MLLRKLYIFFFVAFSLWSCVEKRKANDKEFIKIGNYTVTKSQFLQKWNESDRINSKQILFDNYISTGILINNLYRIYENEDEFNMIINHSELESQIKVIKKRLLDDENLKINDIKTTYSTSKNKILRIDYIMIPSDKQDLYNDILNLSNAGSTIWQIVNMSSADKWKNEGAVFVTPAIVYPGYFLPNIAEKVYNMKRGDKLVLETKSHNYIIENLQIYKSNNLHELFIEKKVRNNLNIANAIKTGKLLYPDSYILKNIKIDDRILSSLDFSLSPLKESSSNQDLIAIVGRDSISKEDFLDKVLSLPFDIQLLFSNKTSCKKASIALLKNMFENRVAQVSTNVSLKDEVLEQVKLKLNKSENKDTIAIIDEWVNSHWLKPPPEYETKNVVINFNKIDTLLIPISKNYLKQTLARSKNWELTMAQFQKIFDGLSEISKQEVLLNNNSQKLINYLIPSDIDRRDIVFNNKLLKQFVKINSDILGSRNGFFSESDTIAEFGGVIFTVGDLRWKIYNLPEDLRTDFYDEKKKSSALRKLVLNEYWLNIGKSQGFYDNPEFLTQVNCEMKNILVKVLYEHFIRLDQINVSDEAINLYLRRSIDVTNQQHLKDFLLNDTSSISIDKEVVDNLGINYAKSVFLNKIKLYEN